MYDLLLRSMKSMLFIGVMLVSVNALAQRDLASAKFINLTTVSRATGYSQAVEIDLGNSKMLIISGQVALDKDDKVVGGDNFEKQADQVFTNIKNIVENSGGSMSDLVKVTVYLRNVSNINKFREVRNRYITVNNPPASTLVEVTDLARDEFLLEVEATAVILKKE